MSALTLLLMVDAFRPDYLRDAPFLRSLAATGATGRLREPFGFLPHAAYFAGLSPEQYGYTNLWCYDPRRSPFSLARRLPAGSLNTRATASHFRPRLDEWARAHVSSYAAGFVSSLQIPAELLPHLAVAEVDAPWSANAGYRSLFHELEARGDAWFACAWPASNALPDHSDTALVEHALRSLGPQHRFAHIHIQELDAAGHYCGPESRLLRDLVRRTDALVESLIATLRQRYETLKIIIFGDHGMVSVTRSIDVRPALASTGFVSGVDYVYFLDSVMVRLWFLTERSRPIVLDALSRVSGIQLLTAEDKVRHRIAGCHPSNAHEIFLADPGVVISPDFFTGSSSPAPVGMHGYDPDCADNQGVFIAVAPEIPVGDAGVVDATDIYHWTRELLGHAEPSPARVSPRCEPRRLFTQSTLPSADACVGRQLEAILTRLQPLTEGSHAILLSGSFGRGEGAAAGTGSSVTALNDFDLLVVGGPDISSDLASIAPDLARSVDMDFLDLAWTDGTWSDMVPTMFNLDLRYGSQVLRGSSDVFDRMPTLAAGEIPRHDALTLLLNRTGGVLSGLNVRSFGDEPLCPREARYLTTQVVKALVAIGDAYLVEWRAYDPSYRVRRERFYRLKLDPHADDVADPVAAAIDAAWPLLEMLRRVASSTFGKRLCDVRSVSAAIRDVPGAWIDADNERLSQRPELAWVVRDVPSGHSIRQRILAELPLLLAAMTAPDFEPRGWETERAPVVSAWLAMNHSHG
jgi:predicted AlkP superfamily pyrophosphatase or phosphodiesterase